MAISYNLDLLATDNTLTKTALDALPGGTALEVYAAEEYWDHMQMPSPIKCNYLLYKPHSVNIWRCHQLTPTERVILPNMTSLEVERKFAQLGVEGTPVGTVVNEVFADITGMNDV